MFFNRFAARTNVAFILAEFIIHLAEKHPQIEDFKKALTDNGAEFSESFVGNLLRIIHLMKPPKTGSKSFASFDDDGDHLAKKFPGLAIPNEKQSEDKKESKGLADSIVDDMFAELEAMAPPTSSSDSKKDQKKESKSEKKRRSRSRSKDRKRSRSRDKKRSRSRDRSDSKKGSAALLEISIAGTKEIGADPGTVVQGIQDVIEAGQKIEAATMKSGTDEADLTTKCVSIRQKKY